MNNAAGNEYETCAPESEGRGRPRPPRSAPALISPCENNRVQTFREMPDYFSGNRRVGTTSPPSHVEQCRGWPHWAGGGKPMRERTDMAGAAQHDPYGKEMRDDSDHWNPPRRPGDGGSRIATRRRMAGGLAKDCITPSASSRLALGQPSAYSRGPSARHCCGAKPAASHPRSDAVAVPLPLPPPISLGGIQGLQSAYSWSAENIGEGSDQHQPAQPHGARQAAGLIRRYARSRQ